MQWHPVGGGKSGVPLGNGDVLGAVFQALDGLHLVAQLFKCPGDQQGLEHFLVYRAFERLHHHAFAGLLGCGGGLGLYGSNAQQRCGCHESEHGAAQVCWMGRGDQSGAAHRLLLGCWVPTPKSA